MRYVWQARQERRDVKREVKAATREIRKDNFFIERNGMIEKQKQTAFVKQEGKKVISFLQVVAHTSQKLNAWYCDCSSLPQFCYTTNTLLFLLSPRNEPGLPRFTFKTTTNRAERQLLQHTASFCTLHLLLCRASNVSSTS
jgi:hypothetical protein